MIIATVRDPVWIRVKRKLGPLLEIPAVNALRGVPLPNTTRDDAQALISRLILEGGRLVARVGETEGRMAVWYLRRRLGLGCNSLPYEDVNRERLKSLAGYFPTRDESIDLLANRYLSDISRIDLYASWTPHDRSLCPPRARRCRIVDLEPFFFKRAWTRSLEGRRVTVVSPFKETIERQWKKRDRLFPDGMMPDFQLSVVKAPQTQCQVETTGQSWFENLSMLEDGVARTNPEVVIVGAGAYGLPVGACAARAGATAIVLGGATQLLFGIMGNRWLADPRYAALQNEYWARPGESERPKGFEKFETAGGAYW